MKIQSGLEREANMKEMASDDKTEAVNLYARGWSETTKAKIKTL